MLTAPPAHSGPKTPDDDLALVCRATRETLEFLGHFSEPAYRDVDIGGASKSAVPGSDADLQHVAVMPPHVELEPCVHK